MSEILHKSAWAHLIPHAGGMCLLDAVVAWDERTIHAISASHRDPANLLRRDGRLHAVHLAEYGAQATAVHGALRARATGDATPRPGLLVSLRDLQLACETIDDLDGELHVHAECLHADAGGAQYTFRIEHCGTTIASGRAVIAHPAQVGMM
jgi:predicted hotdog family 3-hydroxylacyl-ACP dehydratase